MGRARKGARLGRSTQPLQVVEGKSKGGGNHLVNQGRAYVIKQNHFGNLIILLHDAILE